MPKIDVLGYPQYPFSVIEKNRPTSDDGSMPITPDGDDAGQSTSSAPLNESLTNVTNQPPSSDPVGSQRPDSAKDVYGNNTWKEGDPWQQVATRSPRDPAGLENPEAGAWHEEQPIYCDSCNRLVTPEEIAFPQHLGHDLRADYGKRDFDISHAARCGGNFPVGIVLTPRGGDPATWGDPQSASSSSTPVVPDQYPNGYVFGKAPVGGWATDDNNWTVDKNNYAWAPRPFQSVPDRIAEDVAALPNTLIDQVDDRTVPM